MAYSGASNTRMELKNYDGKIIPLYNASHLSRQLQARGRRPDSFSGKVNSLRYTCRGQTAISGWFLTDCKSIADLLPKIYEGTGYEEVSLTLVDTGQALADGLDPKVGNPSSDSHYGLTIEKLYVTSAYAVTGVVRKDIDKPDVVGSRTSYLDAGGDPAVGAGGAGDNHDNQMYVIYVTDYRYFTSLSAYTGAFNLREKLWPDTGGSSDTINFYEAHSDPINYTWQTMITALWGAGSHTLGHGTASYPSTPPENYHFWGVNAFDALMKVLDDIDHTIVRNPNGTTYVHAMKTLDTTSSSERELYKTELIEVSNDLNAPILPEKIRVVFPKWDYQFQTGNTDEITPQDYWNNRPIWYVEEDTATIISGSSNLDAWKTNHGGALAPVSLTYQSGSAEILHDGLIAQFDPRLISAGDAGIAAGGPNPENNSAINTQSSLRATAYIESKLNSDNAIFREIYRGYIPFTPTKDISCITWKNTGEGAVTIIESVGRSLDSKFITTSKGSSRGSGGGETSSGYDLRETSSRRVSQEFPGSPDHARLSEPVLRWAIVLTKAEAAPGVKVNCDVLYGLSPASSSSPIVWHDTADKDIIVTNISITATMPVGSRVLAYWNEQIREWVTNWFDVDPFELKGADVCARVTGVDTVTGYTQSSCISDVELISANTDSLLRSFYDPEAGHCNTGTVEMLISINPAPTTLGHVIHSDGTNVRWSEGPHIGKHLIIGSQVTSVVDFPPYVTWNGNKRTQVEADAGGAGALGVGGTFTLMMKSTAVNLIQSGVITTTQGSATVTGRTGDHEVVDKVDATVIFPNNDGVFKPGMHMSIKETGSITGSTNNCLKMRWTSAGVWGMITVPVGGSETDTYNLWFDDGLLVAVERLGPEAPDTDVLGPRVDQEDADCTKSSYTPPDPCPS